MLDFAVTSEFECRNGACYTESASVIIEVQDSVETGGVLGMSSTTTYLLGGGAVSLGIFLVALFYVKRQPKQNLTEQISNDNTKLLIKEKYENAKINFNFFKFTDKSDKIYQGVNLAISRGGAITLSELAYLNIPFIVIPLPSARDNHQFYNSEYYFQKKVCWIIDQKKLDVNQISNLISNLFKNDKDYANKIHQLEELNKKNNWNTINNHIIEIVNEN